jgi:acyl carrier protein
LNNSTAIDTIVSILEDLGVPAQMIKDDTLLHKHLGLDSVETVKLSLELKRKLGIDLKLGTRQDITISEICQMAAATLPAKSS